MGEKDKQYYGSILTREDIYSEHNNYISTLDSIGNKDYYIDQSISVVPQVEDEDMTHRETSFDLNKVLAINAMN